MHRRLISSYDKERYGVSLAELGQILPVHHQRCGATAARIMRTRAMFQQPWSCTFTLDCDDELIDQERIERWLDIAGRRIGLGDWRPEKSGDYGRFRDGADYQAGR